MFAVLLGVEALASRAVSRKHAQRTTSQLLSRGLGRSFQTAKPVRIPTLSTARRLDGTDLLPDPPTSTIDQYDIDSHGLFWDHDSISKVVLSRQGPQSSLENESEAKVSGSGEPASDVAEPSSVNRATRGLLKALEQGNSGKIHSYLRRLVSDTSAGEEMRAAVANLPQTAFSELLRRLDPFAIRREVDVANEAPVGPGLTQHTPLSDLVDTFGIKILYVRLLRYMKAIVALRRGAGHQLLLSDYNILLRCAGAASDVNTVKQFEDEMIRNGYTDWWQAEIYNDFCRARFLTEPLYTQHDLARFRVRPRNLHRAKLMMHSDTVLQIDRLRTSILRRQMHRFGQNPNVDDYAEHITRLLRKPKPVARAVAAMDTVGAAPDEKLVCTIMIAQARTGGLYALRGALLKYWGITINENEYTGEVEVGGGRSLPPDSPLVPSDRLLDAVVHGFCCNAEVAMALKLVDFISTRYGLHVRDETWSSLLEWTHILASKQVAWEWKIANFPQKVVSGKAVRLVWDTMVKEPYNFKPGIKEYNILLQELIAQGQLVRVMDLMRELRYFYDDAVQENENALFELVQTLGQQVEATAAMQRYRIAQSQKAYTWHCFNTWCRRLLKRVRGRGYDDELIVRILPQFIDEFGQFMPPKLSYRTATGYVDIKVENPATSIPKTRQSVELPAQGFRQEEGVPLSAFPWIAQQRSYLARLARRRATRVPRPEVCAPERLSVDGRLPARWLERELT